MMCMPGSQQSGVTTDAANGAKREMTTVGYVFG
jgi:hypothetical protein